MYLLFFLHARSTLQPCTPELIGVCSCAINTSGDLGEHLSGGEVSLSRSFKTTITAILKK